MVVLFDKVKHSWRVSDFFAFTFIFFFFLSDYVRDSYLLSGCKSTKVLKKMTPNCIAQWYMSTFWHISTYFYFCALLKPELLSYYLCMFMYIKILLCVLFIIYNLLHSTILCLLVWVTSQTNYTEFILSCALESKHLVWISIDLCNLQQVTGLLSLDFICKMKIVIIPIL